MSTGLLRGLAVRALGLEAPLRSQPVRGFEGAPAEPALAVDPSPMEPRLDAAAVASPEVRAQPRRERAGTRDASSQALVPATPHAAPPLAAHRPADGTARRDGSARSASAPVERDRPGDRQPAKQNAADLAPVTTSVPPAQPKIPTPPMRAADAEALLRTIQIQAPPPLLPASAPSLRTLPLTAHWPTAARSAQAARTAGVEAPTEVHVSIGRVELTALALPSAARTPARREAPAGRSLADYLRGSGTSSTKRPA